MYKCCECGHLFEEGEQVAREERHGFAKAELEEMFGCKLEDMTEDQKAVGFSWLLMFEGQWNK